MSRVECRISRFNPIRPFAFDPHFFFTSTLCILNSTFKLILSLLLSARLLPWDTKWVDILRSVGARNDRRQID